MKLEQLAILSNNSFVSIQQQHNQSILATESPVGAVVFLSN